MESTAVTGTLEKSYDDLPYPGLPFSATHPNRLATVATLYGLNPPPVETARVLELGCGTGGNLIPMALTVPEGRFFGIDLSGKQIEEGCSFIEQLGLTNIELQQKSILDLDAAFGAFDYILTHGVFSWVPGEVREKILEICASCLAPDGVAYISYNTYPGWHLRNVSREILKYHSDSAPTPQEAVHRSRQYIDFLAGAMPEEIDAYGLVLKQEAHHLSDRRDAYVFHEYLESENHPLYFHQFIEIAESHGLGYVGDSEIDSADRRRLAPQVHKALLEMSEGFVDFEQRADFVRGRMFRHSLLCRGDRQPQRPMEAGRVRDLLLASQARPAEPGRISEISSEEVVEFQLPEGRTLTTNNPLVQALLLGAGTQWPRRIPFAEACRAAGERLGAAGAGGNDDLEGRLAEITLECFLGRFVELHAHAPQFARPAGERPEANPVARLQVARGQKRVTNLLHLAVDLDPLQCVVLPLLDGRRDREALLQELVEQAAAGSLTLQEEGAPVTDPRQARRLLEGGLEAALESLGDAALLIR